MDAPLVSIVMAFYNGERLVGETLDSVFGSGYPNLEVIVVDDGSRTGERAALDPYAERITFVSQENRGQAAARNAGIARARGAFIGVIDQDDLWPKGHLDLLLPPLREGACDFARGMTQMFVTLPDGTRKTEPPAFQESLMGSALYARDVFDRVGLLDPNLREGEDFDWNIRLRESGCRERRIPETTLLFRNHEQNHSKTPDFIKNGQLLSLKRKIDRARALRQGGDLPDGPESS